MKKSFKKVLACLLAVLMVLSSAPISALAYYDFSGKEGYVDLGEDDYINWDGLQFGDEIYLDEDDEESLGGRNSVLTWQSPEIVFTVSSMGTSTSMIKNQYYGYSTAFTYDKVKAAGNIKNPADLKAGDLIAIACEVGGLETLYSTQVKGNYNPDYLIPCIAATGADAKANTAATPITGTTKYYSEIDNSGTGLNLTNKTFNFGAGIKVSCDAQYVRDADTKFDSVSGLVCYVFTFRVLQDCDLKDVWTLYEAGVYPYDVNSPAAIEAGIPLEFSATGPTLNFMEPGMSEECPVIFTDYEKVSDECTHEGYETEIKDAVTATCAKDGYTGDTYCTNCDEKIADGTVISKSTVAHTFDGDVVQVTTGKNGTHATKCSVCEDAQSTAVACTFDDGKVTTDPTLTTEGVKTFTCTACGNTYTETIDPLTCDHKGYETYIVGAEEATCGEDGYTGDTYCSNCDKKIADGEVIDKSTVDHTVNFDHTPWLGTEGKDGTHKYTCTVCHEDQYFNCTFDDGKVTTDPTFETPGEMKYTCTACGNYYTEEIPVKICNHDPEVVVENAFAVEPTCTEKGYSGDKVCMMCRTTIEYGHELPALGHNYTVEIARIPATVKDAEVITYKCERCDETETQTGAPALGVNITVAAIDLGTVTVNGVDVTAGGTVNVPYGSTVELAATPDGDATFYGWVAEGSKIISNDAATTITAIADIKLDAVINAADNEFTVVFYDAYGNALKTQTVKSAAEIVAPAAPEFIGYKFAGWSEDITAITASTAIIAKYDKLDSALFSVTAADCTIESADASATGKLEDVAFDTLVTVSKDDATAWEINGAIVAYGPSYSFYVGSNVIVNAITDNSVKATPVVAAVSTDRVEGSHKVVFLATRSMAPGCKYVNAGFIYGKNLADSDLVLEMVGKTGSNANSGVVKAYYCTTNSEQFSLSYGITGAAAGSGIKASARAFLAYEDAKGEIQVVYAGEQPQVYNY